MITKTSTGLYKTKRDRQFTAEDETVWVRKKLEEKAVIFSMIEKKTGAFIGNIELMEISDSVKELGIGKDLLDYAEETVHEQNGKLLKIGIMEENERLIQWYIKNGFVSTSTKRFEHLPYI